MELIFDFEGISMAPWVMSGDRVFLDTTSEVKSLRRGDVVVVENELGQRVCHRVVKLGVSQTSGLGFVLKGDRVPFCDDLTGNWKLVGKVVERFRLGSRERVLSHPLLAKLSLWGLYPGQVIPLCFSRTRLKKLFYRQ